MNYRDRDLTWTKVQKPSSNSQKMSALKWKSSHNSGRIRRNLIERRQGRAGFIFTKRNTEFFIHNPNPQARQVHLRYFQINFFTNEIFDNKIGQRFVYTFSLFRKGIFVQFLLYFHSVNNSCVLAYCAKFAWSYGPNLYIFKQYTTHHGCMNNNNQIAIYLPFYASRIIFANRFNSTLQQNFSPYWGPKWHSVKLGILA